MKNRSRIILLAASAMMSVSVMALAKEHHFDLVIIDDGVIDNEISKIEPFAPHTFVIQNYDCSDLVIHDIAFEREYTIIDYKEGSVQNKALPLCKKIWLINCQIALK